MGHVIVLGRWRTPQMDRQPIIGGGQLLVDSRRNRRDPSPLESMCLQPDSGHIRYKLGGALSYFATVFIISPSFSLTHHFTFIFFLLFSKKGKPNKA